MAENVLVEKWQELIETDKAKAVSNKEAIAQLLENEENYIVNEASQAADMAQYTPILVPAIRRIFPNLLANEIVGVQPMNAPTGYAYALRYAYDGGQSGTGSNFQGTNDRGQYGGAAGRLGTGSGGITSPFKSAIIILSTAVTGTGPVVGTSTVSYGGKTPTVGFVSADGKILIVNDTVANITTLVGTATGSSITGTGLAAGTTLSFVSANEAAYNAILPGFTGPVTTANGETMGALTTAGNAVNGIAFPAMKMSLERIAIEAMSRKLKAEYSIELAQDLKAVHGLDAEAELINILEYEITAEIDRELVVRINNVATSTPTWYYQGYSVAASASNNLSNFSDGRWEAERFRTLYTRVLKEANQVAITTRRGTANFIVCSANIVSAFESLSNFMYSAVPGDVKPTLGVAKVGTIDGRFSVYMDTFATADYITVGYKGASQFDTGVIYCPYVPLLLQKVTDPNTFQPKIAFMTRDAIAENLFGAASYYRTFTVDLTGSSLAALGTYGGYGAWNGSPTGIYGG